MACHCPPHPSQKRVQVCAEIQKRACVVTAQATPLSGRALTRLQQCARLLTAELLSRRPAIGGVIAHLNQTVLPYEKMHVWPATSAEVAAF